MRKPDDVLARDAEWATLSRFVEFGDAHLRLGVVSGRRRVGKSYLLRALVRSAGGLYVTAVAEEDSAAARRRFAADITRFAGIGANLFRTTASWEELLSAAVELVVQRHGPTGLLVIDELPYWMAHSPEVPGLLQLLYDRSQAGDGPGGGRLIVCGSAISVMNTLLSGGKALRGRATIDMKMSAFDLSTTASYWGINDPATALYLHATLGGSPGYRNLTNVAPPQSHTEFDEWVAGTVLDPGQALFSRSESEYLLREDPKFTGSALHYAILNAVASGATSPAKIGGLLERDRTALNRPLEALQSAGFIEYQHDPLWKRRPVITVADPIIRFHNLITVAQNDLIETGRAAEAWRAAHPTFIDRILGPHFEECARTWVRRQIGALVRSDVNVVASSVINDRSGQAKHESDVLALHRTSNKISIALIGEAKATVTRRGSADLERLESLKALLEQQGHDVTAVQLAVFSMHGFHNDLLALARKRADVLLVDLPALFDVPVV